MVMRTMQIDAIDWENFKRAVGDRNASATIRNFIKSCDEDATTNEKRLRKELEIIENEYKEIRAKYLKIKEKVESLDKKRKLKELKEIDEQAEIRRDCKKPNITP